MTELDLDEIIDTTGIATLDDDDVELPQIVVPKDRPESSLHRRDISRFLFVDIETIPDWDRLHTFDLEVPGAPRKRTPAGECPDVQTFLGKTLDAIKAELRAIWPDSDWLVKLMDAESKKDKPRAGVREAVNSLLKEMDADLNAEAAFNKKLSTNPLYNKIVALGLGRGESDPIGTVDEEVSMLNEFWECAAISNPLVGFNCNHFDFRTILIRSMLLGVRPSRKLDIKPWSDSCLDLMIVLFGGPVPGMNLKAVARMYGMKIREEGVDGSQVSRLYAEDPQKLRRYVASDVELTRDLFRKIEGYFV